MNDINGNLTNLYMMIRDRLSDFVSEVMKLPYSEALKKCEEALERAELGIGYDESLFKKFGDAIEDRNTVYDFTWQLTTWIHDNIDAPFKNDFDTYAWSPLSDIDYRKYEIDNDIGVTTKNSHPNAQGIIIEKKKLNLKDFLGSENEDKKSDSKNSEQVDDFAKIFKEQYKNLSKTMSEGDEKVKLPDMRKFWDPESKTADERFKEFLSMVADATIIVPIVDAIIGKDIITGEELSAYGVTSKILIAVIDVITLGIGSLSNPAVSGVIKEYALGLGAATVSAAVYEVADASGLPPAVINALTIGAGIVTVIIGNKVLFKNKAGKVLATKDIDELKNPRVRGNEAPPLRNELDDYLDDVGDFYENDVFGHYYDEWPELDDYFDELARHSEDIDVGSVSKCGSKADVLAQNRANGRAFEQQEFAKFSSQNNNAVEQITVKTSSGVRTRVDAIGLDANGNVVINEYKSSLTAPLTSNQKIAFPEIFESGATVVGKGKGIFSGGYQIPPGTKVTIIRPE